MNFLAHIYLSGEEDNLVKIGNFMADTVRGKQYLSFPEPIQKGILLHRQIDTFTDTNPTFRSSRKRLVPKFGHYSGVITDVFYDYFLAKNWNLYSDIRLEDYVQQFYELLECEKSKLNEHTIFIMQHMIKDNWLLAYASLEGMEKILYQMDRRTGFKSNMQYAIKPLIEHESVFESEFFSFFEDIRKFIAHQL